MNPVFQTALIFLLGMIAWEIAKRAIDRFFVKTIDAEYVTVTRCRQCRDECRVGRNNGGAAFEREMKDIGKSLDLLRGVVLVVAVKIGVESDVLRDLAKRKDD